MCYNKGVICAESAEKGVSTIQIICADLLFNMHGIKNHSIIIVAEVNYA